MVTRGLDVGYLLLRKEGYGGLFCGRLSLHEKPRNQGKSQP